MNELPRTPDIFDEYTYDEFPLCLMELDTLLAQPAAKQAVYYVWPYEGQFLKNGNWKFHGGKVMDGSTEIDCPTKPLLIDMQSAHAFKLVWEAINEKNKEKTREFLQSRGLTFWAFDKLVWPNVSYGGR